MEMSAQSARHTLSGQQFEVDPFWPKPLPERWVTGELGGVCVDANDHIFVLSRANLYPGIAEIAQAAPAVMEFDQAGNVVNSWGDRQVMEGVIDLFYGVDVHVWIAEYKTDPTTGPEAPTKAAFYSYQADIYRRAATKCLGLPHVSFHLLFLRAGTSVELT